MARRALVIGTLFASALAGAVAHADQKADKKFCDALVKFHTDFAQLESIGPSSSMGELRKAADKVSDDADRVQGAATKIKSPAAKEFVSAAKQLRQELHAMPDSTTVEQAKSRIRDDVQNVKQSGHKLAMESGCPMQDQDMNAPPSEGMKPHEGTPPSQTPPQ
jgi:uncharacterized phage infection (PIP) family protein YhgE